MANIRDVAREAGVCLATVSHVNNSTRPVSAKTRQKVEGAIKKLGYRPNALARGLCRARQLRPASRWLDAFDPIVAKAEMRPAFVQHSGATQSGATP